MNHWYCFKLKQGGDGGRHTLVGKIALICVAYVCPMFSKGCTDAWHGEFGIEGLCMLGAVGCLFLSALICKEHFPERLFPGKFNFFGSHAIMHILVHCEYLFEWAFINNLAGNTHFDKSTQLGL